LQELRQLDSHVKKITGIQEGHGEHLTELTNISTEISNRCDKVDKDLKAEIKRTANLMSAHSASLLQEVRASFSREVKELAALHSDVQVFLKDAEDSLQHVKESLDSTSRYVEASLHEVRLDIESLDGKRDRDKQVLEDSLGTLQQQAESSATSLEQLGRTLEHFSTVLGLSLKGQRMVIALGVQDFVDRKDTTYVGFKKGHTGGLKFGQGLDSLTDLPYQPGKVTFQSDTFERPQLLALCEKMVHSGQEALSKGPKRSASNKENSQIRADSPGRLAQGRVATARCGSRQPGSFRGDRVSTAATTKAPATADSRGNGSLGCCSPPWTGESQRLPTLPSVPLTAR